MTALAVLTAVGVYPAKAPAASPEFVVALEYRAPASGECPDADQFRASVGRQLGYDAFRPSADRRVAVEISRKEGGFDSWVKWSDARGNWVGDRRLSTPSSECGQIAANTAFAVAVQIQLLAALAPANPDESVPGSTSSPAPNEAAPEASATSKAGKPDGSTNAAGTSNTVAPKPSASDAGGPPSKQATTNRARFRLSAGFGASLALGVAPHPTGIGRIFVNGRVERFSLELAVDAALPTTRTESDGSGFDLNRFSAGLAGCGHVPPFAACLTATLGRLGAHGFGVDEPASPAGWFTELGVRIVATHEFGDLFFAGVRADGLLMLSTWSVTLDGDVLWTTPRVGGLIGADFGVNFF